MPNESRLTKYTVLKHEPGPLSHGTDKIGTYTIPPEIVRQGNEAVFKYLVHQLKEDLCNQTK